MHRSWLGGLPHPFLHFFILPLTCSHHLISYPQVLRAVSREICNMRPASYLVHSFPSQISTVLHMQPVSRSSKSAGSSPFLSTSFNVPAKSQLSSFLNLETLAVGRFHVDLEPYSAIHSHPYLTSVNFTLSSGFGEAPMTTSPRQSLDFTIVSPVDPMLLIPGAAFSCL
jgi:hypothetical protein